MLLILVDNEVPGNSSRLLRAEAPSKRTISEKSRGSHSIYLKLAKKIVRVTRH